MRDASDNRNAMRMPESTRLLEMLAAPNVTMGSPAVQALAREVISRLDRVTHLKQVKDWGVAKAEVTTLCNALLSADETAAETLVLAAQGRGMPPDVIHLRYIAEAARMMGVRWEEDETSAAEVIIGAGRIYLIMRKLRAAFVSSRVVRPDRFRAVFAAAPGETHTIGVTMAADYLRRRGWQIDLKAGLTHEELVDQIGHDPYPIIGLSASSRAMIFPLTRLIVALRITNPGAWIMVGGQIVEDEPEIVDLIDADGRVTSADEAVAQMEIVLQTSGTHQAELPRG